MAVSVKRMPVPQKMRKKVKSMNFLGDYFALAQVIVLCMFYFDREHVLNRASKHFVACLIFTALTAVTDLMTGKLLVTADVPIWLNMTVNSLYFLVNILTTSSIALYLFIRILEHSHDNHCMSRARIALSACLLFYFGMIVANIWTGWMFYFDAENAYHRGPLNSLGYIVTLIQMGLVVICYTRNKKNASQAMRRTLCEAFPVAGVCILIQRMHPEVMLNSIVMIMVVMILFLNFQGQRQGVHVLTKLNDRHRFFKEIESRIAEKQRFQVFLINIKNFGNINQKYGHMFGDEVLYQFAFTLEKLIKTSVAFHMNGTVFALVLPYLNQRTAEKHLGTLLHFLEGGIDCAHDHINFDYVTVEAVVLEGETDASEFYEKLEFASSKAYKDKVHYIRCTPDMGAEMSRRRYLIERMEHVDREHGYQVWYQPICSMDSERFTSMEALVRLIEPDGSVISPAEFIPIAEETGMLGPITWFVLEETCRMLADHPELQFVSVGVNLPMQQLMEKGFITRLNSIVDRHGIDHRCLCMEFTERAILENFTRTKTVMEQLTHAGYRFYLDDFGSGYSNFNCLLELPFQFIKLDANLVRMDGKEAAEGKLVQNLTSIFHNMQLKVIAEGVETHEDALRLKAQGVDRIQGFYYAKPMPDDALLMFYQERGVEFKNAG